MVTSTDTAFNKRLFHLTRDKIQYIWAIQETEIETLLQAANLREISPRLKLDFR